MYIWGSEFICVSVSKQHTQRSKRVQEKSRQNGWMKEILKHVTNNKLDIIIVLVYNDVHETLNLEMDCMKSLFPQLLTLLGWKIVTKLIKIQWTHILVNNQVDVPNLWLVVEIQTEQIWED